jgi:hypothetical protein
MMPGIVAWRTLNLIDGIERASTGQRLLVGGVESCAGRCRSMGHLSPITCSGGPGSRNASAEKRQEQGYDSKLTSYLRQLRQLKAGLEISEVPGVQRSLRADGFYRQPSCGILLKPTDWTKEAPGHPHHLEAQIHPQPGYRQFAFGRLR